MPPRRRRRRLRSCRGSVAMTVKELILELSKHEPNRKVVMSSDELGSSHTTLTWVEDRLCDHIGGDPYSSHDSDDESIRVVVLWP